MKIELTDISPVRKSLSIEVDADEVSRQTDELLKDYRRKARIPGFRKGKAPLAIIRAHFAKEAGEDVRERIISSSFLEATREKGLEPLGDPSLEDVSFEEGRPLSFKTVFEVLPQIEPKGYRGIEVTRPVATVTDEEVRAALEELRRARTRFVTEEGREAAKGDVVYANVAGDRSDGESIERERVPIEVGGESTVEAFNEQLIGARAGSDLEFSVDYPDNFGSRELAGKRVDYRIHVEEVKRPEVPDLDDEFAKDVGDFEDLAELEAKIRSDLEERKKHDAEMAARQAVLDKVLIENPVVLPDVLVAREIRRRLEEIARNLILQGIDPEQADIDWEGVRKKQEEPARKSVHARLVLDAVARVEEIAVTREEIDERIAADAKRLGETPQKLRARLQKHSGEEALSGQLVREKSLDYLTSVANIQYAD
jgi:trigger factor